MYVILCLCGGHDNVYGVGKCGSNVAFDPPSLGKGVAYGLFYRVASLSLSLCRH